MRIGVFDSGIGGEAVAKDLSVGFPYADIVTADDRKNVPYGNRDATSIISLTDSAIQPLLQADCDVIVIACNTATAVAIETLRSRYPRQKFIGLEPMVKPALRLTKTGVIAVCATPATLASKRYRTAKSLYASDITVFEPDCSDWATLIENNSMNRETIDSVVQSCLRQKADVIILGCTHYHWIKDEVQQAAGESALVVEPTDAIIRRIKELLRLESID